MKKFLYKFLVVMIAFGMLTPSWITKMWVPTKAMAANVNHTYSVASTTYSPPSAWNPYLDVMYTNGSQPGASAITDMSTEVASSSGVYSIDVNWTLWNTQTSDAIYQVWDNGSAVFTSGPINQKLKFDGSAGVNGDDSGYLNLGSFALTGISSTVVLSGTSADNGNVVSKTVKIAHANVVPTVPVLSAPAHNSYTASASANLQWVASTDSDDSSLSYNVKIDGASIISVGTATSYNLDISAFVQGAHTWQVQATDGVDFSAYSSSRTFIKDNVDPILGTVTGTVGTTGGMTTITASATDVSPLTAVISFDAGLTWTPMNGTGPFTYDYSVASNSVASVPYVIEIADPAGNFVSASGTIVVTDNDAPVIHSNTATPDTTGEVSIVSVNSTDNIGITSFLININGAGFVPMLNPAPDTYTYPITLPANHLDPVSYVVSFNDLADNGPTAESKSIIPVDNDKPVITLITGTTGTTGETTTVIVSATDNIAPTAAQISVDGGPYVDMTGISSPFTYGVVVPSGSVAGINYSVRVRDAAGIWSTVSSSSITVTDNDKPTSGLISINSGDIYSTSTSVTLTLSSVDNILVTQMSFRNGTSGAWSAWGSYATTKSWVLTSPQGTKTVQARFRDAAHNVSNIVSDSIILDTEAPIIAAHDKMTVAATSLAGAVVNYITPLATDNMDATADAVCTPASGSTFPIGITSVTCNKTDSAGNSAIPTIFQIKVRNVVAEDFGVMQGSGVNGYTVGFGLQGLTAQDVTSVKVELSKDLTLLSTSDALVTSPNWLALGPETSLSSPFNIDGAFNYVDDGYWSNTGWNGTLLDIPTKAVITVVDEAGNTYVAENTNPTGDPTMLLPSNLSQNPTIISAFQSADKTISINFNGAGIGVTDYIVFANGIQVATIKNTLGNDMGNLYHLDVNVSAYQIYAVKVVAYHYGVNVGEAVANADVKASQTSAVIAPIITTTSTVVSQPATPQVSIPSVVAPVSAPTVTAPVEQGQIKGVDTNESQESEKINWTPWIILFILIILAGAATGGYFYWFGRDDEEEIITKEVIAKGKKSEIKEVKSTPNKSKRW